MHAPSCTPIDPQALSGVPPARLIELYRTMLTIRIVEDTIADLVVAKEISCPCHLYAGQECVAVATCAHLHDDDHVYSTHRSHGHFLAKGGDLQSLISEVFCRADGASGGWGGSMHLSAPDKGFPGSSAIVAGTIPLAVGAALAFSIRREPRVAVAFFGDGATTEGSFYEAMNFAALKKLPVVFVCENNFYSTHMPIAEIQAQPLLYKKAEAFAMPGARVDGYNFGEMYRAAGEAVDRARAGKGPTFLECLTYRFRGHVGPNNDVSKGLRSKEEVEAWTSHCAIVALRDFLLALGYCDKQTADAMEADCRRAVDEAVNRARCSPSPSPETLTRNVFKGRA